MKCMHGVWCVIGVGAAAAQADLVGSYAVGSGANTSFVQFEFANTNAYLYEVRYDGALFGDDLFAIIAAAQPGFFSYQVQSFSFGDALFGVSIGADSNAGRRSPAMQPGPSRSWASATAPCRTARGTAGCSSLQARRWPCPRRERWRCSRWLRCAGGRVERRRGVMVSHGDR
jgi:hypothetical protein